MSLNQLGPLLQTSITSLKRIHQGKVRDIYAIDDATMLLVSTDRLSAFDVILPTGIANKGAMLTQMANFWFEKLKHVVPNHLTGIAPESVVSSPADRTQLGLGDTSRAVVVKRLKALPIEAIVRGYLVGSGWKEYKAKGTVCGIKLPSGLQEASKLPTPIFTPSSKAAVGEHDENISIAQVEALIGKDMTQQVAKVAIQLYTEAAEYALTKGIIIADTKFEFGLDAHGVLHVMDEVLTPDSSRFWPLESYKVGSNPPSYDKQYVRDWLESIHWNKAPPAPALPDNVAQRTSEKYLEAFEKLTGKKLATN
jgi:phosphoribosylaminoimidazole-succinocarboxamide synthase